MIRLLLKTYTNGKKYLCKRESDDYLTYLGSGKNVTEDLVLEKTDVLFETEDRDEFKKVGIYFSELFDVVNDPNFLNEKLEEGDGGDTLGGKKCYNDGSKNAFFEEGKQPEGWERGRWDKHNFTSEKQRKGLGKKKDSDLLRAAAIRQGKKNGKPRVFQGKEYPSLAEMARQLGVTNMVARRMLKNDSF